MLAWAGFVSHHPDRGFLWLAAELGNRHWPRWIQICIDDVEIQILRSVVACRDRIDCCCCMVAGESDRHGGSLCARHQSWRLRHGGANVPHRRSQRHVGQMEANRHGSRFGAADHLVGLTTRSPSNSFVGDLRRPYRQINWLFCARGGPTRDSLDQYSPLSGREISVSVGLKSTVPPVVKYDRVLVLENERRPLHFHEKRPSFRIFTGQVASTELVRRNQVAVDHLQQLRDAKLVHAGLALVGFRTKRFVQALGKANSDDAGWFTIFGRLASSLT